MKRLAGAALATVTAGLAIWWLNRGSIGQTNPSENGSSRTSQPSSRPAEIKVLASKSAPAEPASRPAIAAASSTNIFAAFSLWEDRYAAASPREQANLIQEGKALAQQRAAAMASLIQNDPKQALDQTLSYSQRKKLPEAVSPWIEQTLNTKANFEAIGSTPSNPSDNSVAAIRRAVRVDGQLYEAYTYGAALQWPSQPNQAVNGIVLPSSAAKADNLAPFPTGLSQGIAAISPNPARILDTAETSDYLKTSQAEPLCGISGLRVSANGAASAAQIGGNYTLACSSAHLQAQIQADDTSAAGTAGASPSTYLPTWGTGTGTTTAAWTKGLGKRYIFCRPVFPDYSGYTSDAAVFAAYEGYSNYVTHTSYRQLVPAAIGTNKDVGSFVTPPLLLPSTVAAYEAGTADITQDIINALHAAGISLKAYQFFCIVNASKPGFNAAGLGSIGPSMGTDGGSQSWCRLMGDTKSLDPSLLGHELGHNLYLSHSHGWDTGGRSVIGPGSHVEYGDPDSLMGETWGRDSYTANLRNYLGWISGGAVQTVIGQGLRHINLSTLDDNTNGVRAVRVKHPSFSQYYWLEYRSGRSWMDATEASESIGLRWGAPNGSEAWWLPIQDDRLGINRLALGHTFSDPSGDIHITPLSIVSNSPITLEVAVAIGPFVSNSPPVATLVASTTFGAIGSAISFTIDASDPDGDALAYGWDFGGEGADGPVAQNTNRVSHTFTTTGLYNVRCQISDLKGGSTTESVTIRIGTPAGNNIGGIVATPDGTPLEGIRLQIDSTHYAFTDSSGHYLIAEVPIGTYTIEASDPVGDDLIFESWLPNPLVVNRSFKDASFTALDRSLTSGARVEYYSDGIFSTLQSVNRTGQIKFPGSGPAGAHSARWTAMFNAPLAGTYLLHAIGDGLVRLILNGQAPGPLAPIGTNQEATAYIQLAEGQPCTLEVDFTATSTNSSLNLQWTTPAGGTADFTPDHLYPSAGGLRGSYYASNGLTNLAFSRIDPIVNFPSGVTPGPRLPGDTYSVRWTGTVQTRTAGTYKFITTSDDGVRLWVAGKQIINDWNDHAPKDDTGTLSLAANRAYDITLEYYQGTGGAEISLQWIPPRGTREVIPAQQLMPSYSGLWAEYYDVETLDGSPKVTQIDPVVDSNFNSDSPTPGIASTTYSIRWQGMLAPPADGNYQFAVWADDAARLWVNGVKILDNWGFQGAGELTGNATLTSNTPVPIRLEMQQIGGNSGVRLLWTPPGGTKDVVPSASLTPQRTGLWAEFYNSLDLSGVAAAAYCKSAVSEDYGANGLPSGIASSAFSGLWRGRISTTVSALHRIYVTSAGGARLYWDGQLVLDDWSLHPKHDASFSTNMAAGVWHDIRLEYHNEVGNGSLQLSWSRNGLNRQTVPSVNLRPPAPIAGPLAGQIVGSNGGLQLRWAAGLGPLQVLSTPDLTSASTNWTLEPALPFLSNGLWNLNLNQGTNAERFFTLNPAQ